MSHDDDNCNFSNNESFQEVLARGTRTPLTRRNVIRGGTGMVALSALPFLSACGGGDDAAPTPGTPTQTALGFPAVAKSLVDDVLMPPIGLLLGGVDFTSYFLTLKEGAAAGPDT